MKVTNVTQVTLVTLVTLLVLDAGWLTLRKNYHDSLFYSIQKSPLRVRFVAAAIVYILLAAAIFYVAIMPAKSLSDAAIRGAAVGFFLYAFYDATNMATLSQWTWYMFFTDIAWGTAVSAVAAAVGYALM